MATHTFARNWRIILQRCIALTYHAVTVRIPSKIAKQCKDLANVLKWQLADLQRTLICIGAVFALLGDRSHESEQAAVALLGGLELLKPLNSFALKPRERPYARRMIGRSSTLLTLNLPDSLCEIVTIYSTKMKASRNQTYCKLLEQGLLVYLKAQMYILNHLVDFERNFAEDFRSSY